MFLEEPGKIRVQVPQGLIGNPVEDGSGRAAVTRKKDLNHP